MGGQSAGFSGRIIEASVEMGILAYSEKPIRRPTKGGLWTGYPDKAGYRFTDQRGCRFRAEWFVLGQWGYRPGANAERRFDRR